MSNINWNQFFTNVSNFTINVVNNAINQSSTTGETYIARPVLPQTGAQLSQTTAELASLSQSQTTNMVKELYNLPKNFDNLLTQLTQTSSTSKQQSALMLLASSSNLSSISALLQNNSKTAMTNLYTMTAQYNQLGVTMKEEQMNQITKLISFISSSSTSDVQSLKTIMLMYLPWLPLTDPNVFKLEILNKSSDDSISDNDSVTLLILTENYGNLKADVIKTEEDGIKIEAAMSETFPQKEFISLMKEEGIKYSININFEISVKSVFNKKQEKPRTEIYMNTSPGVNPFLLLISNTLIKNVHIIDSKENLREARKEKLDNGKS